MDNEKALIKEKIKTEYATGKYTFAQLSEKFNISLGTIKTWSKKDKDNNKPWVKIKTIQKTKGNKTKTKQKTKDDKVNTEVTCVIENDKLTDKQKLFCMYYIRCFNASKAALKAGYSKENYGVLGYQLLQKPSVRKEIERLKQNKLNRALLSQDDILQKYIDIAFTDITDYIEFGKKLVEIQYEDGSTKEVEKSYVDFKNDYEVDGTLISEVSKGKDGVKVKLYDKMKALDVLRDIYEMNPEYLHRQHIDGEKIKLERERLEEVKRVNDSKMW